MAVLVVMVSSTPRGMAVVLVMVVVMVIRLQGHVEASPLSCGLSLVVCMKVHTGFIMFVGGL